MGSPGHPVPVPRILNGIGWEREAAAPSSTGEVGVPQAACLLPTSSPRRPLRPRARRERAGSATEGGVPAQRGKGKEAAAARPPAAVALLRTPAAVPA